MSLSIESGVIVIDHNPAKTINTQGGLTMGGIKRVVTALTAATTLTDQQSGGIFTLGTAGGFAVTLPAVSSCAGCEFIFLVKVAPTTAYTIVTNSSENKIHGALYAPDLNAASDSSSTAGTPADRISFVANKSQIGDCVSLFSDGSLFYARAFTGGNYDSITFDVVS